MKMNRYIYTLAIFLMTFSMMDAQQFHKSRKGTFLLKNGTLHTISKGTMEGDLLIKNGKIDKIGKGITADAEVIDCSGKHVYPGFIDSGTQLGLAEIGAVSLSNDFNELGDFIPHMQALTAVNPNSVSIPVTRTNGVTSVFTMPEGGLFPGTGALINLHGYTPEQMYADFKGVIMNYPTTGKKHKWDKRSEEDIKKDEAKATKKLNDIWDKAVLYTKIDSAGQAQNTVRDQYNPQMETLKKVVRGELALMIEVNKKADILSALKWVEEKKIPNVILTGVAEGYRVAKEIKASGLPVLTGPVLKVPNRSAARYDVSYKNAGVMKDAGIKVAIRTMEKENVRNLPFNAAFAATYGLGVDDAVKAITLIPAQIFGVDDMLGSLEEGKLANLFVCDGDPFEMKTIISKLFIQGYDVPMESRHTLLYDEFLERDPGIKQ